MALGQRPRHHLITTCREVFMPDQRASDAERITAILERLDELGESRDGKRRIHSDDVRALIRDDLELVAGGLAAIVASGKLDDRHVVQRAMALAIAYAQETGDDSFLAVLQRAARDKQLQVMVPESDDDGAPGRGPPIALVIDKPQLRSGDIHGLTTRLSIELADADDRKSLRALRARCVLMFKALDDDPRPVWRVPEARSLVRTLHEKLPYFPYYLNLMPRAGMFLTYFGCLTDDADLTDDGIANLMAPTLVASVAASAIAISNVCSQHGWDPRPALNALLQPYPADTRQRLIAELEGSSGR